MIVYKKDIDQAFTAIGKKSSVKFWIALLEVLKQDNRLTDKGIKELAQLKKEGSNVA